MTVSKNINRWLWPFALSFLTLFAFAVRWYYVSTAVVVHPVRGDAIQYVSYAWNLLEHHTFSKDLPDSVSIRPDNYRDPGYPIFLALLMSQLGTDSLWYSIVLLSQSLISGLTVMLATQLGTFWIARRWAMCAGLLMAIWPPSITMSGFLLSETLFSFLCVLGLLLWARACRSNFISWGFASGIALGSAALTNAILLPFGFFLAGLFCWLQLVPRRLCLSLVLGATLLPGAWAMRNMQLPSSVSGESSRDRALQNFVVGAMPGFHVAWRDSIFGNAVEKEKAAIVIRDMDRKFALLKASPIQGLKALFSEADEHPLRYAFWYVLQKPYELWGWAFVVAQGDIYVYPTINSPFMTYRCWIALAAFCKALNPVLLLLMVAGTFLGLSRAAFKVAFPAVNERSELLAVICLVIFVTLIYALLQAEPRYSIAFRPFEILIAITAVAGSCNYWLTRKHESRRLLLSRNEPR